MVMPTVVTLLAVSSSPVRAEGYWYDPAGVSPDVFGTSMTELGDINSDGFDEFLIGVAGSDSSGLDAGQVFLWFGGAEVTLAPDRVWNGTSPEMFGWCVANIGDVNRDGRPDWAVGAPLSNAGGTARGRVCIFYGGSNPASTPDVIIAGTAGGDQFGTSISAAGDFDGDGADDFIVGAPYSDVRATNAGAAYVIYGQAGGPSTNLANATVLAGEIAEDHFGWSVSDAGNFLAGNEQCVAVGAPLSNTHGGIDAGAVYVFKGRTGGAVPDTTIDFVAGIGAAAKANSQFGYVVRGVGRINSDTNDDLAVGAPFCNEAAATAGRVEIFYGGLTPAVVAGHAINGQTATDNFGWSLDRVGNVSGTTRDDVLIGAPFRDQAATDSGRAYIYEGGSSATSAGSLFNVVNNPVKPGTAADDHFGWAVAYAGDFDGDALPDYAIAAPSGNIGSTGATAGFVTLVHSTAGPVPTLVRHWQAVWRDAGQIELGFAFALPNENIAELVLVRQVRDADGSLRSEDRIWSGSARVAADGLPDVLADLGDSYRYLDTAPALVRDSDRFSYAVTALTGDGQHLFLDNLAGPGERPIRLPALLAMVPAWPNPANPAVTIRFRAAAAEPVNLQVLDLRGRLVRELHRSDGTGAWQEVVWHGQDDLGQAAASGVYLIRLAGAHDLVTQRVVLAR
jgi:hypothetical protein